MLFGLEGLCMRILLTLWFLPLLFFWGWYGLSANDIHFGTTFFSRQLHDVVMSVYGDAIGVSANQVPAMIAGACALDTAIIMAIAAFRWRESWYPQLKTTASAYWHGESTAEEFSSESFIEVRANDPMHPAE